MELGKTRALRGPNIWSQSTVLETILDLSDHAALSAKDLEAIHLRVGEFLGASALSEGELCGSFFTPGLGLAELFVRLALEMQTQAGSVVSVGRVAETK